MYTLEKKICCKKKKCHIKCCWNALDLVPYLMFAEQNSKMRKKWHINHVASCCRFTKAIFDNKKNQASVMKIK